jgi:hypothetical protein
VNSISLILEMWFDMLHIWLSRCNVFETKWISKHLTLLLWNHLNFLDQWIKLLLSWSFLCDDCLKTMNPIYISIYFLSLKAIHISLQIFLKKLLFACPADRDHQADIVPSYQTMSDPLSLGVFKPLNHRQPLNFICLSPWTSPVATSLSKTRISGDWWPLGWVRFIC